MNYITLAWMENGERVTRTLEVGDETIHPGVFRIGRDPDQCDVVMPSTTERERTVSRCHVEISYDADRFGFYLTNLKANNPPYIKGEPVDDSVKLTRGCMFELGEVELVVEDIAAVPETIIIQRPRRVSSPQEQVTILPDRSNVNGEPPVDLESSQTVEPDATIDQDATIYPDEVPEPEVKIERGDLHSPQGPVVVSTDSEPSNPSSSPAGSVFDRVKDQLFSCPNGHKYTLAEAKELGWICKYDGYLITSTFVAK